jgi:hypothetical protein
LPLDKELGCSQSVVGTPNQIAVESLSAAGVEDSFSPDSSELLRWLPQAAAHPQADCAIDLLADNDKVGRAQGRPDEAGEAGRIRTQE